MLINSVFESSQIDVGIIPTHNVRQVGSNPSWHKKVKTMKMNKAKLVISAALVMAVSAGMVKAEDSDMTQIRTQDRVRTEVNLQAQDNEAAQARVREQKMEQLKQKKMQQEKAQVRNEYKKNIQVRQNGSESGSMMRQNMMKQTRSKH